MTSPLSSRYIPNGGSTSVLTTDITDEDKYVDFVRMYEVVANPDSFSVFPNAFEKNIYREQQYSFTINKTIDLQDEVDFFGSPHQELFLYFVYKPITGETLTRTKFPASDSIEENVSISKLPVGSLVYGDRVSYSDENFREQVIQHQEYFISTRSISADNIKLKFKYRPFIPIRISNLENTVQKVPVNDELITIPWWAKENDGYYYFQNSVDYGQDNPDTGLNLDFPFLNNSHIIYENFNLFVKPDLTDLVTSNFFEVLKSTYQTDGFLKNMIVPKC